LPTEQFMRNVANRFVLPFSLLMRATGDIGFVKRQQGAIVFFSGRKVEGMVAQNISTTRLWVARIMSGLVILFMLFDGIFKLIQPEPVITGTLELGYAEHHIALLGILALVSTVLYALPRTAF
ncbi:UNVERIFIED_CONTAM: DoxX family protein, partial [Klebsiella pneumoniae]